MLYVVRNSNLVEDNLFEPLQNRSELRIISTRLPVKKHRNFWKWAIFGEYLLGVHCLRKRFYDRSFYAALREIGPDDRVLIFDPLTVQHFLSIVRNLPTRHVYTWVWNSGLFFSKHPARRDLAFRVFKRHSERIYTFDHADSVRYAIPFKEQVFSRMRIPEPDPRSHPVDLVFIGTERNRLPVFRRIMDEAQADGLTTFFHIVPSPYKRYGVGEQSWLSAGAIPYAEVLRHIGRARCLIEIVQSGQHGCTLRAMEALFFGKKLVTDNPAVEREAFYRPENVYRLGREERSLREFLDQPMVEIPSDVIQRHDIAHWIDTFLD